MTDRTTYANLAALLDELNQHPNLPPAYIAHFSHGVIDANWYLHIHGIGADAQRAAARNVITTIGGKWDKAPSGDRMRYTQKRPNGITLDVVVTREAVCERVVVGTETKTIPAQPAAEATPERTETVEVVEWRCSSLLGGAR